MPSTAAVDTEVDPPEQKNHWFRLSSGPAIIYRADPRRDPLPMPKEGRI